MSIRFLLVLVGLVATACVSAPPRPNILFIMADDHTVQAMGCYGSRINQTPQLDRLAREGVRFNQAFCTNAICGPARATLLTGKYSHRNGVLVNGTPFDGGQVTFPKLLQGAGYQTALVGKWHLGSPPTGFDYWNVLPGQGYYYNPDFNRMGEKRRVAGYVTDLVTDDGLAWLEKRDRGKPFCLLLHFKAPHRNWMPSPRHHHLFEDKDVPVPENFFDEYRGREAAKRQEMSIAGHMFRAYDLKLTPPVGDEDRRMWNDAFDRLSNEQKAAWKAAYAPRNARARPALAEWKYQRYIKDYLRCVAAVDENIGRVLDYLDRAGLADDTVVVYTSDQGFFLGEHGWYDKRFMYREAHGIPLLMRYPKDAPARVDDEHMALNVDFAPTILDYAGVAVPRAMQGRSLRPVLRGEKPADWRRSVYYHYFEYPAIHAVRRHYGVRTKRHVLIHFYHDIDRWELYDLERDPREMHNVYDDPAYADVVRRLKGELARLRKQYGDTEHKPRLGSRRRHKAVGRSVTLRWPYSPKYPGGLTDGKLAPEHAIVPDYARWQGFEQVDLDAVIDLGKPVRVEKITVGCLQHVRDWIFLPRAVSFAVSDDGVRFRELGVVRNDVPERKTGCFRHEFVMERRVTARYIRVRAENVGTCPDWHPGAGGKAWVFVDELAID